jgi:hypothetical protein
MEQNGRKTIESAITYKRPASTIASSKMTPADPKLYCGRLCRDRCVDFSMINQRNLDNQ